MLRISNIVPNLDVISLNCFLLKLICKCNDSISFKFSGRQILPLESSKYKIYLYYILYTLV